MAAAGPAKAGPALTVSHHQNGAEDGPGARLQCKLFFDDVLSVRADELIGFGLVATQGVCVFDSPRFSTTFAGWIMRGSDSTRFTVLSIQSSRARRRWAGIVCRTGAANSFSRRILWANSLP